MKLSEACDQSFEHGDQQRGEQLVADGGVQVLVLGTGGSFGTVKSSKGGRYRVAANFAEMPDEVVGGFCECPRYAEGYNCKHLWAFLRELDNRMDGHVAIDHKCFIGDCEPQQVSIGEIIDDASPATQVPTSAPTWRRELAKLKRSPLNIPQHAVASPRVSPSSIQRWFALRLNGIEKSETFEISLYASPIKKDGTYGVPRLTSYNPFEAGGGEHLGERKALALLAKSHNGYADRFRTSGPTIALPGDLLAECLSALCATGRFVWTPDAVNSLVEYNAISFSGPRPWRLSVQVSEMSDGQVAVDAILHRDASTSRLETRQPSAAQEPSRTGAAPGSEAELDAPPQEQRSLNQVLGVCKTGAVLFTDEIGILEPESIEWAKAWRKTGPIGLAKDELPEFMHELLSLEHIPDVQVQQSLGIETVLAKPIGSLIIDSVDTSTAYLETSLFWVYGQAQIKAADASHSIWDTEFQRMVKRDTEEEKRLLDDLFAQGVHEHYDRYYEKNYLRLHRKNFLDAVQNLTENGWEIRAEGARIVRPSNIDIKVESGEDWFDLQADVKFGEQTASLPTLLQAIKKGERYVQLGDGTKGILPEEWLEKYDRLIQAGTSQGDSVRFASNQALLLDMMLEEEEGVQFDRRFSTWCKKLKSFSGVKPRKQPRSFKGELREYQTEALGWLTFLKDFGLGGCLADDMGLGKTVQILAHLESRRTRRLRAGEHRKPSLVVVPKSLVFNWGDEAARFVPQMRVLDYTGIDRKRQLAKIDETDIVITTYATMRRDIEKLRAISFDYVILDEAQAVKNPGAQVTKAARLLKGDHRLAMTGTPVENHLGDLWSLFDFLNPGMLGSTTASQFTGQEDQGRRLSALSNALRPFILRRTKQQVLTELPEKTEQTLVCEMLPKQRKLYNELRDHYRAALNKKIEADGIKRSKIQVLEALLRLRQVACDPRLVDPKQKTQGAKIEHLLAQLSELLQEGHKVLVFSQFTTLLGLVRKELEKTGIAYEYLDGKTRNRAECVKRFQEDADCQVFLISLKAGGHGLNLTSANYVFILDPWWNPAVEAQAIDRAHRMGQVNPVTAYRFIAKDTVEDKIIKLQESKRELADAIVSADSSLISNLSMADLRLLFE